MASDVTVKITLTKGVGELGFGIPLILASKAESNIAYKEYSNIAELATDYPNNTEVYKVATMIWLQDEAPARIAICSSTKKATETLDEIYHENWRQLITVLGEDDSTASEVSTYMETRKDRLYFVAETSAEAVTTNYGTTKPERTVAMVHATEPLVHAALVGATAGRDAGSFTYKNIILKGVAPENLTDAKIDEIHLAGGIAFVTKSGDNVTTEGKSVSGEYVDIVDSKDYIVQQITYKTQKLLNSMPKIPYDNTGIAMLETCVTDVLNDAFGMGIIAVDKENLPDFSTSYALRSDVPEGERAERKYLGGTFKFGLAGAIHNVEVHGEIIV